MKATIVEFYYDYADPVSYVVDACLAVAVEGVEVALAPRPFGGRRPREGADRSQAAGPGRGPAPGPRSPNRERTPDPLDRITPELEKAAERIGLPFESPDLVPGSRKAHELALYSRGEGRFLRVHETLFRALWTEGRDIGRVDVLVEIGLEAGLEADEVKVVLDVDKYGPQLDAERSRAERLGVEGVPTLLAGSRRLEGFHRTAEILTFLEKMSSGATPM